MVVSKTRRLFEWKFNLGFACDILPVVIWDTLYIINLLFLTCNNYYISASSKIITQNILKIFKYINFIPLLKLKNTQPSLIGF